MSANQASTCQACGKPANFRCPKCHAVALPPAFFCGESCFKKSWKTHKIIHDHDQLVDQAKTIYNKGRFAQAAEAFRRVLTNLETCFGANVSRSDKHLTLIGETMSNIGASLSANGHFNEALEYEEKGLKIRRDLSKQKTCSALSDRQRRVDLAASCSCVASTYSDLGRFEEAATVRREAISLYRDLGPEFARTLAAVQRDAADDASKLGQSEKARALYQEASSVLAEKCRSSGSGREEKENLLALAADLEEKGNRLVHQEKKAAEGISCLSKALTLLTRQIHGNGDSKSTKDHGSIAQCLNNLGAAYEADGRFLLGLVFQEKALEMRFRLQVATAADDDDDGGQQHPTQHQKTDNALLADSLTNVGIGYLDMGLAEKALSLLERALAMQRRLNGDDACTTGGSRRGMLKTLDFTAKALRAVHDDANARLLTEEHDEMKMRLDEMLSGAAARVADNDQLEQAAPPQVDDIGDIVAREKRRKEAAGPGVTYGASPGGAPHNGHSKNNDDDGPPSHHSATSSSPSAKTGGKVSRTTLTESIGDQLDTETCYAFAAARAMIHAWRRDVPSVSEQLPSLFNFSVVIANKFGMNGGKPDEVIQYFGASPDEKKGYNLPEEFHVLLGESYFSLPKLQVESMSSAASVLADEATFNEFKQKNYDPIVCFVMSPQRWEKFRDFFSADEDGDSRRKRNTGEEGRILQKTDLHLKTDGGNANSDDTLVDTVDYDDSGVKPNNLVGHAVVVNISKSRFGEYLCCKDSHGKDFADSGTFKIAGLSVFPKIVFKYLPTGAVRPPSDETKLLVCHV